MGNTAPKRPLRSAAYYLNPHFHYRPERVKIDLQLDLFKNVRGLFGMEYAVMTRSKKSPG
jgi:hypothetical protein